MKTDTILKLIDAGYTKAEIQALEDFPAEQQKADEHDKPADEHDKPADEHDKPADEHDKPAAVQPAGYDAVLEALNKLTNSIIKSNINSTVVQPAEHTLDDALASIIAPPMNKKK